MKKLTIILTIVLLPSFIMAANWNDVNRDDIIDDNDIKAIRDYIIGNPSTDYDYEKADLNKDGIINVADLVILIGVGSEVPSEDILNGYVELSQMPNAVNYLPEPVGQDDPRFIDDRIQWEWGKTQRTTERAIQAKKHALRGSYAVHSMMAGVLGLNAITYEIAPALSKLLDKAYWTGWHSATTAKSFYKRPRPFAFMGEEAWIAADKEDDTGSFVSATTAGCWAAALILAEMWPPRQESILRQAFLFGEDRVISGSNFQSDVNGGYLSGSASVAQAHNNELLKNDILTARDEYRQLLGMPADYDAVANSAIPLGYYILNPPVNNDSYRYEADLEHYRYAKTLRDTPRVEQAIADGNESADYMFHVYSEVLGIDISPDNTPNICKLIEDVQTASIDITNRVKWAFYRPRPFEELEEPTAMPEEEIKYRGSSSYPSGHTSFAWSVALVLAEVIPAYQDQILRRGYDFGYNRLVSGYHWSTDIEAARILASINVAYLHNSNSFCYQITQARTDYLNCLNKQE